MNGSNTVLPASLLAMLNGTNNSTAGAAGGASAATGITGISSGAGTGATGGQQPTELDFLNLMMQQLKNQDPTKPMDDSAIMGQLAQFGTVTGISQLNSSFTTLSSQLVSSQALQASSLLGHNVLVSGASAPLATGGALQGAVNVPANAGAVSLQVVNAAGVVVRTIALGSPAAGLAPFSWNGATDAGTTAAAGTYSLVATGTVGGKGQQLPTLVQAQVSSITLNGGGSGGLTLQLAGIGAVPLSAVQQIN